MGAHIFESGLRARSRELSTSLSFPAAAPKPHYFSDCQFGNADRAILFGPYRGGGNVIVSYYFFT
jgi:hypothetical protein